MEREKGRFEMQEEVLNANVRLELRGAIALIFLNRPQVHNAVNDELITQWEKIMTRIENNESLRAIVLTAAGTRSFCSGSDLTYFATLTRPEQVREICVRIQEVLQRLYKGRIPVIAAINGNAMGGGCEILSACHLRVASPEVRFQFKQTSMGVVTGWGGAMRLFQQLGTGAPLRWLLTGEPFEGKEALEQGFVHQLVPASQVLATALQMAESIASGAPKAVSRFLQLAHSYHESSLNTAQALETDVFVQCWTEPWFQEALRNFQERKRSKEKDPE